MSTAQPKTKLDKLEAMNILQALHDNSRRTTHVIYTANPCFMQCWYPNPDIEIPEFKGPVCQFVYNGGKRSPMIDKEDAAKLLTLVKGVRSRDWSLFPGHEGTHELKSGRVKLSWTRLWFVDSQSPRFQTNEYQRVTDKFLVNLQAALINFIAGGKGADAYPVSIVTHSGAHTSTDELFAVTDFGYTRANSKPSWLAYTFTRPTNVGCIVLNYGEVQFHIRDGSIQGVNWEFFIGQLAWAVIEVISDRQDHVEVFEGHPTLGKYNIHVRKYKEGNATFMVINTDQHAYNNKVMFALTETNAQHLKDFFTTIIKYHS